ncbi:MAG: M14 family metallopeptidase, partial [Candidatus Neomarinimicrobiota bacterium]
MIFCLGAAFPQGQNTESSHQETPGLMVIRVQVRGGLQPDEDIFRGLDVVRYHRDSGELEMVTTRREYEALLAQGYQVEVTVWDSKKELLSRLQWRPSKNGLVPAPAIADLAYFRSYDEVVEMIHDMQANHPDLVKVDSIGHSHEGHAIWLVKIAENVRVDDPTKAGVYYDGLHHAREHISPEIVLYFMNYLLTEYAAGNPRVVNILANRQLWFIPIVNPDGHKHSFNVEPLWRKNRRDNGDGTFGVDLNRNYPYLWGYDDIGSSPLTSAFDYRGPNPASEPEVQAILNFFEGPGSENRKIAIALSYHASGNYWLLPWGYTLSKAPDFHIIKALGDSAATYNGYAVGSWPELLRYQGNGSALDYLYHDGETKARIFSMTPEVGPEFIPDISLIPQLVGENLGPNLFMAEYADLIGRLGPITTTSANQYMAPGSDSVVVTAAFTDPENLAVNANINSVDSTQLNTMILYNDGSHNDGETGDSLFGNAWAVPEGEYYYNVGVEVSVAAGDTITFGMTEFPGFTTQGPVVYGSYSLTGPDTLPQAGDRIYFFLGLTNEGNSATVRGVSAVISSSDTCIAAITRAEAPYGDIAAGATVVGGGS